VARILLSAYACEPGRGSEPGVGWSWATELAQLGHAVTVITRADNRSAIEQDPLSAACGLTLIYYDLPQWMRRCRRCAGGKQIYYVLWQWFAVRYLRTLFCPLPFDVVHHVTYVSARYPSFMGLLGIPFFFGPVSGGEGVPPRLRSGFSAGTRCRERLRDLSNFLVPFDPLMRHTFRRAERILVTRDTLALVPRRWHRKCEIQLAIGLSSSYLSNARSVEKPAARPPLLLFVGRLLEWKGIAVALRAVSAIHQHYPRLRFVIAGDGPTRTRLAKLSHQLGLENVVEWAGWRTQPELEQHYRAADLLLFPSMRDSGGMVVLEALAHGLPVLCTNLGGPGQIVNDTCGRAVPTSGLNHEQLADKFAQALCELLDAPDRMDSLSDWASARARQFDFHNLARLIHPQPALRSRARQV
jgi:glycosyltransferase involved in cell wall biosynthesis